LSYAVGSSPELTEGAALNPISLDRLMAPIGELL